MKTYRIIYENGEKNPKPPQFKNVSVVVDEDCPAALELGEELPKRIRNEIELAQYRDALAQIKEVLETFERTRRNERLPWNHVLQQIEDAVVIARTPLEGLERRIRSEIERFETLRRPGVIEHTGSLEAKATEEEQRARYAETPKTRATALAKARQYREEVATLKKELKVAGMAVHVYWEPELIDPKLVLRNHPEFLSIDLNERAVQAFIKEKQKAGVTVTEGMIPGIRLVKQSSMSLRK